MEEKETNRPFAYADPRSLSQAWYDELHRAPRDERAVPHAGRLNAERPDEGRPSQAHRGSASGGEAVRSEPLPAARSEGERRTAAGTRDGDEKAVARASRHKAAPTPDRGLTARTDVEVSDGETAVRLLLAQRGGGVEVVAVCDRAARERAADALARARIALAAKGIAFEATIRERSEA